MDEIKQVIVMRKYYPDGKGGQKSIQLGKMIAQGSHASSSFLMQKIINGQKLTNEEENWVNGSYTKVCVRVDSEEELLEIFQKAKDAMLTVHLITDSGRTEFSGIPTKTCLAIGPDIAGKIDKITGHLKLL